MSFFRYSILGLTSLFVLTACRDSGDEDSNFESSKMVGIWIADNPVTEGTHRHMELRSDGSFMWKIISPKRRLTGDSFVDGLNARLDATRDRAAPGIKGKWSVTGDKLIVNSTRDGNDNEYHYKIINIAPDFLVIEDHFPLSITTTWRRK